MIKRIRKYLVAEYEQRSKKRGTIVKGGFSIFLIQNILYMTTTVRSKK